MFGNVEAKETDNPEDSVDEGWREQEFSMMEER